MSDADAGHHEKGLPGRDRYPLPTVTDEATGGGASRREFLMAAGFTFAGALLAGCRRAPLEETVPPLIQTESVVSGRACEYATTCGACSAGCGMLVRSRDGRPIKLEGDPDHPLSRGGLCAAGQASLLGLYDRLRLQHPLREGQETTWQEVDRDIRARLDDIRRWGGTVRVLSGTITSPTTQALLRSFLDRLGDGRHAARHVVYDPVSCSAILDAHEQTHGARVLPRYHLDRADVIAGFDADFLGTWITPVEFTHGYRAGRLLTGTPPHSSYHVQVESRLSLTGSKADERVCVAPEEIGAVLARLAVSLASKAGVRLEGASDDGLSSALAGLCDRLAKRLWKARGRSLVLCGSQDVPAQVVCNFINHRLLGNYGATLDVERPSLQRQGSDRALEALLQELDARKVAALFILDSNPVYDLPDGEKLANALQQVPLVVCCAERLDETARLARYVCPHPQYLEAWSDAEPVSGMVGLRQPTVPRLGNTRPIIESLDAWTGTAKTALPVFGASSVGSMGAPLGQGPLLTASALYPGRSTRSAYDLLREHWEGHVFPRQAKERSFQAFWDRAVHDGHADVAPVPVQPRPFDASALQAALRASRRPDNGTVLVLYPKVGMPDGGHAYNPWLQELPDPISKVTWDNYACLSPAAAAQLGVGEGEVVRLELPDRDGPARAIELPVLVQPGQHDRVVAVALGYGSILSERFAGVGPQWLEARPTVGENGLVGQNAAPLLAWEGGTLRSTRAGVKITRTGSNHPLASTQGHHTLTVPSHLAPPGQERRPIIQETTLAALARLPPSPPTPLPRGERGEHATPLLPGERGRGEGGEKPADLWPDDHPYTERRWGMVIDLQACTGCSACVVACQAENNIPVVGKDEVRRQREMHWLRIDRYYSETATGVEVAHQPMLCQQCERAPCETVCPVLATTHSADGLNEQVYNRCVGTRYCANNCPYKVRRFNWFAYSHDDMLANLALNPDVTVRSRGVMEKCTFCVQRLQEAKIEARRREEEIHDGEVQTACQQSCPAQAIAFGDLNDPESRVARLRKDPRHYQVLAELNIGPAVGYLKTIRPEKGTVPQGDG
jgi:molybdopterin-containing oxidoreductase family iron-sulfur binding subunit